MPIPQVPKPDWCGGDIELASTSVNVTDTLPMLRNFTLKAAAVHMALFDEPLIITSGNDAEHIGGSKHAQNKALDLRARDLSDAESALFTAVLGYVASLFTVGVFDERFNGP